MYDTSTDTTTTVERRLVDVVMRHGLERVPLLPDDFGGGRTRAYWAAITHLWDHDTPPSVERVHDILVTEGVHQHRDVTDLLFLPLGYRRHLDDYVAHVANAARRRRVAVTLADAAEAIYNGADPEAVLHRVQGLVA